MSVLWKEVTSWLSEATKSAVKETEDLAKKGRIKLEILGINTALNDKFAALGGVVYELAKNEKSGPIKSNPQVKKLVAEIAGLETKLRSRKPTGKKTTLKRKTRSGTKKPITNKPSSRNKTKKT